MKRIYAIRLKRLPPTFPAVGETNTRFLPTYTPPRYAVLLPAGYFEHRTARYLRIALRNRLAATPRGPHTRSAASSRHPPVGSRGARARGHSVAITTSLLRADVDYLQHAAPRRSRVGSCARIHAEEAPRSSPREPRAFDRRRRAGTSGSRPEEDGGARRRAWGPWALAGNRSYPWPLLSRADNWVRARYH